LLITYIKNVFKGQVRPGPLLGGATLVIVLMYVLMVFSATTALDYFDRPSMLYDFSSIGPALILSMIFFATPVLVLLNVKNAVNKLTAFLIFVCCGFWVAALFLFILLIVSGVSV